MAQDVPSSTANADPGATPTYGLYSSSRYDPLLLSCELNTQANSPHTASPFFLLPYHRDRLVSAAKAFGWPKVVELLEGEEGLGRLKEEFERAVKKWETEKGENCPPVKVRPVVYQDGPIEVGLTPTPSIRNISLMFTTGLFTPSDLDKLPTAFLSQAPITFILDAIPTPSSLFTQHKTTSRAHYLAARGRCGLGEKYDHLDEALLWTHSPEGEDEITEASISNVAFFRSGRWVTPRQEAGGLRGIARRWLLEQGLWIEGLVRVAEVKEGEWVLGSNGLKGCFVGRVSRTAQLP